MLLSNSSKLRAAFAAIVLAAAPTFAAVTVPPTIVESATTSGINTPLRNAGRTYEAYYAANQLTSVTSPTVVTGVQFRLAIGENWRPAGYVGTSWPNAPLNFSDYTVTLGTPTAQLVADGEYLSTTPTFASYFATSSVVRTGALTIPAGAYTADGGAAGIHSFGFTIPFSTPYTINPGQGLVMQINLSGYGATGTPLQAFFASTGFVNGSIDAVSSTVSGSAAAPNGFSSPLYAQFVGVPEPTSLALVLGSVALIARRRI